MPSFCPVKVSCQVPTCTSLISFKARDCHDTYHGVKSGAQYAAFGFSQSFSATGDISPTSTVSGDHTHPHGNGLEQVLPAFPCNQKRLQKHVIRGLPANVGRQQRVGKDIFVDVPMSMKEQIFLSSTMPEQRKSAHVGGLRYSKEPPQGSCFPQSALHAFPSATSKESKRLILTPASEVTTPLKAEFSMYCLKVTGLELRSPQRSIDYAGVDSSNLKTIGGSSSWILALQNERQLALWYGAVKVSMMFTTTLPPARNVLTDGFLRVQLCVRNLLHAEASCHKQHRGSGSHNEQVTSKRVPTRWPSTSNQPASIAWSTGMPSVPWPPLEESFDAKASWRTLPLFSLQTSASDHPYASIDSFVGSSTISPCSSCSCGVTSEPHKPFSTQGEMTSIERKLSISQSRRDDERKKGPKPQRPTLSPFPIHSDRSSTLSANFLEITPPNSAKWSQQRNELESPLQNASSAVDPACGPMTVSMSGLKWVPQEAHDQHTEFRCRSEVLHSDATRVTHTTPSGLESLTSMRKRTVDHEQLPSYPSYHLPFNISVHGVQSVQKLSKSRLPESFAATICRLASTCTQVSDLHVNTNMPHVAEVDVHRYRIPPRASSRPYSYEKQTLLEKFPVPPPRSRKSGLGRY